MYKISSGLSDENPFLNYKIVICRGSENACGPLTVGVSIISWTPELLTHLENSHQLNEETGHSREVLHK